MLLGFSASAWAQTSFVNFESGQVRPIALSPDGTRLFAVNTPDNRLEIFDVDEDGLTHVSAVPVGLEPVAVAARTASEVWVVNHLSDSISIVNVAANPPRVTRTLLVGDEPRDIVFAGPSGDRAFITTAHRGQQRTHTSISGVSGAGDPQFITEGVGRADVWVFDATNLGSTLGGTPMTILALFGDTPRALAASADGSKVYAGVFFSGNQTTAISEGVVCNGGAAAGSCNVSGFTYPGGMPAPNANAQGIAAPETGLIVKWNSSVSQWHDELGRNWNNAVRFSLPDLDVFAINANAAIPSLIQSFPGVGTVLFNIVASPTDPDKLYVSNTEARNEVRFEGPGAALGSTTVRGRLHESRITVIDGSTVTPRHLNKHIDYEIVPSVPGTIEKSLATPNAMAVTGDGQTLYVAAFGSSKVGVFSTTELEANSFTPDALDHVVVSGGGPSGLVLDDAEEKLYVFTRFDNGISIIDTSTLEEVEHVSVYNPEPPEILEGRPFLYDAVISSSNGEASCSSCHVFGDLDQLAWDLGNPDDAVTNSPMTIKLEIAAGSNVNGGAGNDQFHPMKGPMTTQTLRGLVNSGPMHWRGDRAAGVFGSGTGEALSFDNFIVAFEGLLGREELIENDDMHAFTEFALGITLPPNPVRALDNSLSTDQAAGRSFYLGSRRSDGVAVLPDLGFNCNGCHTLDASQGFFGTNGDASFENEEQIVKIAHLRNLYQKVGMFGVPAVPFTNAGNNAHTGDQIRGFGFLHDGSIDTIFRFFQATVFNNENGVGFDGASNGDVKRRQMEQFMLAFDNDIAPIVGQQITYNGSGTTVAERIDLLLARAAAPFTSKILGGAVTECDVIVKGTIAGEARGWVRQSNGNFLSDKAADGSITQVALRNLAAPGQELTYTCVPPGSGTRMGIDRDEDTHRDADEIAAGSNPADPDSIPGGPTPTPTPAPTASPSPSPTPAPTASPSPGPTASPSPSPSASPAPTSSPSPSPAPTASPSPSPAPTASPSPSPGPTPSPSPAPTASPSPSPSPTPEPTASPGPTPTLATTNIRSSSVSLKDDATPPIVAANRTLKFKSAAFKGSHSGVLVPAMNSSGDPRLTGAKLIVYAQDGTEKAEINLPAANWSAKGLFVNPSYKYKEPKNTTATTLTKISIKDGKLSLSAKGADLLSLEDAPNQKIVVRLRLGTNLEYCAVSPPKSPAATNDTTSKFAGLPNAPKPVVCPALPPPPGP